MESTIAVLAVLLTFILIDYGMVTALATIGLFVSGLLGGIVAWLLSNEHRHTAVEALPEEVRSLRSEIAELRREVRQQRERRDGEIRALHERLDGLILRRGPRA